MTLEILLPGLPDPPREMHGLIQMHLAQRPDAQRGLQQWLAAMSPHGTRAAGGMTVGSVRVTPPTGAGPTPYFNPSGYRAQPSRSRGAYDGGGPNPGDPYPDPYAYS